MKFIKKMSIILLVLFVTQYAHASNARHSMGGGFIGSTSSNAKGYKDSASLNVFYMYKENPYFGIETGLNLLGRFEKGNNQLLADDIYGLYASFVGIIPLNDRLDLYGKVGGMRWTVNTLIGANDELLKTERGNSLAYGVGLQFGIIDLMSLRLELQQFQDVGQHDISNAAINVIFHFR